MASSGALLTPARHLARHGGAYLGYLGTRAVLKCYGRPKVPTTTPYSRLVLARAIINNAMPLKQATASLKRIL
jgi:hypothetical protein